MDDLPYSADEYQASHSVGLTPTFQRACGSLEGEIAVRQHYFPNGIKARFSGTWEGFAVACTPKEAVLHYQTLANAGIQYFIVELLDAANEETIRLLAHEVTPWVKPAQARTNLALAAS